MFTCFILYIFRRNKNFPVLSHFNVILILIITFVICMYCLVIKDRLMRSKVKFEKKKKKKEKHLNLVHAYTWGRDRETRITYYIQDQKNTLIKRWNFVNWNLSLITLIKYHPNCICMRPAFIAFTACLNLPVK